MGGEESWALELGLGAGEVLLRVLRVASNGVIIKLSRKILRQGLTEP